MSSKERRRTPRIQADHKVLLRGGGPDGGDPFPARSADINLGGIYCGVSIYVDLFTKLEIDISLPIKDQDGKVFLVDLELAGVVVRIEPEQPEDGRSHYDVAMAFVNLPPETELLLAKYMLQNVDR